MAVIRESDLPGIGHKFQVETNARDKMTIIVHDDGMREVYHCAYNDPDDCTLIARMNDSEARQLAGIIGGLAYKPRELEVVEMALDELIVEWYKLPVASSAIGKTIEGMEIRQKTGAVIVAVVNVDQSKKINPGPDHLFRGGDTIIVIGERGQIRAFRRLMEGVA